jgi:serine/threonine protein kinase/Tfp pilus assembly protein PilF
MECPKCHFDNPSDSKFCKECGTQLIPTEEISASTETLEAAKEELTTGSTFAERYQIIEELGKGGMGKVYKVHDIEIKEKVALKLLKPEIAADKKTIERFRNEIRLARKIVHQNVGRMFDLGKAEGSYFITMEYVPGQDLKGLIRQSRQLTVGTTINIAKQICEGLAEAHKLGVVHRDLKPSNIMIDKEGNARIMDFGIARSLEAKGITGAGVMIGTPEYISPEQAEVKEVDQRSDIYSLGVILYEMVTGRVPFEGETPLGIAMKHKSEMPKDPKELNAQIPEDLSRVILRCMEKDKENRYQSAGEVRSELEKIEEGIPTTEKVVPKRKPITSKEVTVTFGLKKLFIPTLVIVALLIAAVVIWQLLPQKKPIPIQPDKPSLAVMYFENNTGDENLDHWRKALSELLIADLSQSKFVRVLSRDKLFNILTEMNLMEARSYSSKDIKEVAARGRVNHILQGAYAKAGDNIRINIMLQEISTGELVGSDVVEGKGEESIFSMVDELTRRVKVNFRLTGKQIEADIDKEIGKITTSSPVAFKFFSEGWQHSKRNDFLKSIQSWQKAVTIDPEFAMAYRSMAASYGNLGRYAEAKEYWRKALDLSNRLSDREQLIIQGDFNYKVEIAYDRAIEFYSQLLKLYPDNIIGNTNLGNIYFRLEQWDKAKERYDKSMQISPENVNSSVISALLYMSQGSYSEAHKVLENYINNYSDSGYIRLFLAVNSFCQGKYERSLAEVNRAFLLDPTSHFNAWIKGDNELCRENFREAEKEYQKLLEANDESIQIWGRDRMDAFTCRKANSRNLNTS